MFNCCPSTAWTIWGGSKNVCVLRHCFKILNESECEVRGSMRYFLVCLRVFV